MTLVLYGMVIVHPCRRDREDRSRVYWRPNYQLIVHSQPPSVSGVKMSIYLSNCQGVHLCPYWNSCRYFHGKWKQVAVTCISWMVLEIIRYSSLSHLWRYAMCSKCISECEPWLWGLWERCAEVIIHLKVSVSPSSCYTKDTFHRKKLFIIIE